MNPSKKSKVVTKTTTSASRNSKRGSRNRRGGRSKRQAPRDTTVVREVIHESRSARPPRPQAARAKHNGKVGHHADGHRLGRAGKKPVSIAAALEPPNPAFVAVLSDMFNAKATLEKKDLSLSHALPRGLQGGRVVPFIWESRGTIVAPPATETPSEYGSFAVAVSPCFASPLQPITYNASVAPVLTGATFASNIAAIASLSNSAYMFGVAVKFTCLDNFTSMTGQVTGGRFYPLILSSSTPAIANTLSQTACFACEQKVQMALPAEKNFGVIVTPENISFDAKATVGGVNQIVHQNYARFPWLRFSDAPTDSVGIVPGTSNTIYRYGVQPLWTLLFDGVPGGSKWDIRIAVFGAYKTGNEALVSGNDMETQHPIQHSFVGAVEHDVAAAAEGVLHVVGEGIKDVADVGEAITDVGEYIPGLAAGSKVGHSISSAAARVGGWIADHT